MSAVNFSIKTDVFEGPLDLLLDLVERRKLLINDISLASVTDEYIAHVAHMQERSLPGTASFVQLAATLLLIKSKSLLPVLELSDEEEYTIDDLEERLKLYQIYRNAAKIVFEAFGAQIMHDRQFAPKSKPVFVPDALTTPLALEEAMYRVVQELPKRPEKPKVHLKNVVSLEDMIERLNARIHAQMQVTFTELLGGDTERTTVIVGFLAILESVKQGRVLVNQVSRFEEIAIEREGTDLPRY